MVIEMEDGLKTGFVFAGRLVALRFTKPVKPAKGVTVTVYCTVPVGTTVRDDGLTLTAKSGYVDAGAEATNVL